MNLSKKNVPPGRSSGQPRGYKPWLKLLVGMALIFLFMFVIAPLGKKVPGVGSMSRFIDERNLRATALYYAEIDEFGGATATLRDHLEYAP